MTNTVTVAAGGTTATVAASTLTDYISTVFSTTTALVGTGGLIQKALLVGGGYLLGHKAGAGTWY